MQAQKTYRNGWRAQGRRTRLPHDAASEARDSSALSADAPAGDGNQMPTWLGRLNPVDEAEMSIGFCGGRLP